MKRLIIIFSILNISFVYAQSPWTQKHGAFYGQLSLNMIPGYTELYIKNGNKQPTERKIQDITLQGWFEWGLMESSTVLLSFPLKMVSSSELNQTELSNPLTADGNLFAPGFICLDTLRPGRI